MADDVLVEPDPNAGMLQPVPGQRFGRYGPLGGENPIGFNPNGVSDTLEPAEPVTANPGTVNSDGSPNEPNVGVGYAAGTSGGYGPEGINGSRVFLPFGLDPQRTPVMGSYDENTVAAKATSAWYQLPPRSPDRPLVTVAAAGAIWYYDEDGSFVARLVEGLHAHVRPGGEAWIVISDLAERLGLRPPGQLAALAREAGWSAEPALSTRPAHPRSRDVTDPLHAARSAEVTTLWRLVRAAR